MLRIYGLPTENRRERAQLLVDHGFDSIVLGPDETTDTIQPALDAGLKVWGCRTAFSIRHLSNADAAPLLCRDVDDRPQPWFGSGCPNQPALREAHLHHIRRVAQSNSFTGFMLDGIRFASPNAGDAFFTCFCDVCRQAAHALDLDFDQIRHAVRALRDERRERPPHTTPDALVEAFERRPDLASWLRFRVGSIIGHVHETCRLVDQINADRRPSNPFQLGAYLFAPSLAPLVGQNYAALATLLDIISPMLYRTLTPGDACLTTEYAALAALNLTPPRAEFSPTDVSDEIQRAHRWLAQSPATAQLVPILQLADDRVADVTTAARSAAPDGLDYFTYRTGHERHVERAAQAARAR